MEIRSAKWKWRLLLEVQVRHSWDGTSYDLRYEFQPRPVDGVILPIEQTQLLYTYSHNLTKFNEMHVAGCGSYGYCTLVTLVLTT